MKLKEIKKWAYERKELLVGLGIALVIVMVAIGMLVCSKNGGAVKWGEGVWREEAPRYYSQLNGVEVTSTEAVVPKVLSIMIDNHPDARAQSGLAQAPVVYEAPVEGGITRYMAIFDKNQTVAEMGPVRSARPYFMDWAREYGNPPYLHVGGSPDALAKIKQLKMWDADQFFWSQYYWRGTNKFAPHNVYTNSENWTELFEDYGERHPEETWEGWKFETTDANGTQASSTPIKLFKIYYGSGYVVEWRYNDSEGYYERYLNGAPYLTQEKQQVTANSVVVQNVNVRVLDDEGRKEILTAGKEGSLRLLKHGSLFYGTWKKDPGDARTKFYDDYGQEMQLAPGTIWVQVIANETKVEVGN